MITIPQVFAADAEARAGRAGREWVERLPEVVERLCRQWGLRVEDAPMHGYLGLVVPVVRTDDVPLVLKVSWQDETTAHEALALRAWNGNGAVCLLADDPVEGALLLERLDHRRTLADVGIDYAVTQAGGLLRRLAIEAPRGPRRLTDIVQRVAETLSEDWDRLGRPFPRRYVDAVIDTAMQLTASAQDLLVNHDLHYENVLAGDREPWLAIDPKVVVGDLEFGLAQLLWTRFDDLDGASGLDQRFAMLTDSAGLDHDRARAWTLVRAATYLLWALGVGSTEDPEKCRAIIEWLIK